MTSDIEETFEFTRIGTVAGVTVYRSKSTKEFVALTQFARVSETELNTWLLGELVRLRMRKEGRTK